MDLKPKEIVAYLDNYIIGQQEAKKAMALALRNRYRRMQLDKELQEDIVPKNILMIGSTGVGKTEIARRLAKMMSLPFIKVEASKYTEVGFVGRDVESMVRDLLLSAIKMVTLEYQETIKKDIDDEVIIRITKKLLPPIPKGSGKANQEAYKKSFEKMKEKVKDGSFDDKKIDIQIPNKKFNSPNNGHSNPDIESMQDSLKDMFNSLNSMQHQPITKEITIKEAKKILRNDVQEALSDLEHINQEAIKRVEDGGIIFLDEIDKIALSNSTRNDPGKEGVQRDLLPIIEGSTVNTKYGSVNTDHILFIGAGAFHVSRPSDLIPELQGRFPIRVELNSLTKDDLYKILTSTKNSLIQQSIALLKVEDIDLEFDDEAIKAMAKLAFVANEKTEDIGARRLHTVIERILEDISFNCEDYANQNVKITSEMIHKKLDDLIEDEDTARYIL